MLSARGLLTCSSAVPTWFSLNNLDMALCLLTAQPSASEPPASAGLHCKNHLALCSIHRTPHSCSTLPNLIPHLPSLRHIRRD